MCAGSLCTISTKFIYNMLNCSLTLSTVNIGWWEAGSVNITFDFMVSKLAGDKRMPLLASLMVSVVTGLEFTIASTSTSSVCNDSLYKIFPCVLNKASRIPLAVLIYLSQTPPMWLAVGELFIKIIQSAPCICKYLLILLSFMFWKDFRNSLTAPMKLLPLSEVICQMLPLFPINLYNVSKKNLYLENEQLLYE